MWIIKPHIGDELLLEPLQVEAYQELPSLIWLSAYLVIQVNDPKPNHAFHWRLMPSWRVGLALFFYQNVCTFFNGTLTTGYLFPL